MTVGIICEYNPLHLGHQKQILKIREHFGPETAIVCAMSGNFVQRGAPAILDKSCRAKAAVLCGADLVLELPVTRALSSAEGFAAGGVRILGNLCDHLCFGAETSDVQALMETARILRGDGFTAQLREQLDTGKSFPAARQAALQQLGICGDLVSQPNNILGIEYCKAILDQGSSMQPFPIHRQGSYHAETADSENPSATAVRSRMLTARSWQSFVPEPVRVLFENAPLHSMAAGERAILGRLRTMTDEDFEALPYGSEGLWRKLMHASRKEASLEAVIAATKSKRYTRTRIDRMILCAFLGITKEILESDVPYTRVLAFNERGREILKQAKKDRPFLNAGQKADHPYWLLEQRCGSLYGLFCVEAPGRPDAEASQRIHYQT